MTIPFIDADSIWRALPFDRAILEVETVLAAGFDPESDPSRVTTSLSGNKEFLLMPSAAASFAGVKVLSVAPDNPARDLEKIQGVYVLFDADTLTPLAVLDGVSLTAIRTPAVALTAVKHLVQASPEGKDPGETPTVVTFGAGIQALNHIRAAHTLWPEARHLVVGRNPDRVQRMIKTLADEGVRVKDSTNNLEEAVTSADILLLCTSTEEPLFDSDLIGDDAVVAATGTHGLSRREVDAKLARRADVAVEARSSALLENGNLVDTPESQGLQDPKWWNLQDLVLGNFSRTRGKPAFYSGVGMSWEDLVLASAVFKSTER